MPRAEKQNIAIHCIETKAVKDSRLVSLKNLAGGVSRFVSIPQRLSYEK